MSSVLLALVLAQRTCYRPQPFPECRVVVLTNAFGASFFIMLDEDEFSLGPVARYRRWFSDKRSLDTTAARVILLAGID